MRDQMTSNRDSGLTAPPRIGSSALLGSFPSDRKKTIIEVFQQKGDPAFICGVDGWIVGHVMEAIEKDINENRDEDEKDGRYLYEISYSEAQTGDEGRIELPAYWDLREIAFEPNASGSAAGDQDARPAIADGQT